MNEWKDGNVRKCVGTCGGIVASFENIGGGKYHYGHVMQYFREVSV